MRTFGPLLRWLGALAIIAGLLTPGARAQASDPEPPAQAASTAPSTAPPLTQIPTVLDGHAWFLLREQTQRTVNGQVVRSPVTTVVFHLPPRVGGIVGSANPRGVVRSAPGFENAIAAGAWWGNRGYFLHKETLRPADPGQTVASRQRLVSALRVLRNPLGGYEHPPGRPETLAPLLGDLDVLGWAATEDGPVALVREQVRLEAGRDSYGPIHLRVLFGPTWRTIALDPTFEEAIAEMPAAQARRSIQVVGAREGFGLWLRRPNAENATLWTARVGGQRSRGAGPPDLVEWAERAIPLSGENWPESSPAHPTRVIFVPGASRADDALIGVQRNESNLVLMLLERSGPIWMTSLSDIPEDASLLPMAAPGWGGNAAGTLAIVWAEPVASRTGALDSMNPRRTIQVREISAGTGRTLYSGPARDALLISSNDFKLLAAMLVMVMIAVILFVLRAEPATVLDLPPGFVPADPVRRIAAALIDYAPGAILAASLMGLPVLTLLRPTSLIGPGMNFLPLGLALLFTALHCTIGDWLAGCSLGKRLMGLRVLPVHKITHTNDAAPDDAQSPTRPDELPAPPRPAFWQALARNLTCWLVPPLLMVAIFDASRRHPGDMLGRTIVVMDELPEDPPRPE